MIPALSIFSALWGNQWSRLAIVGLLAAGFGWVQGFRAVPRVDVAAIERNAIAGRDAHWQSRLAQSERESEARIAEWQRLAEEAEVKEPTPTTAPELAKLCKADPLCVE